MRAATILKAVAAEQLERGGGLHECAGRLGWSANSFYAANKDADELFDLFEQEDACYLDGSLALALLFAAELMRCGDLPNPEILV